MHSHKQNYKHLKSPLKRRTLVTSKGRAVKCTEVKMSATHLVFVLMNIKRPAFVDLVSMLLFYQGYQL